MAAKGMIAARISDETRRKLDALREMYGTQTTVLEVAIELLWDRTQSDTSTLNGRVMPDIGEPVRPTVDWQARARKRVNGSPSLGKLSDIIMDEKHVARSKGHWKWVATAPIRQIIMRAAVLQDESRQREEDEHAVAEALR